MQYPNPFISFTKYQFLDCSIRFVFTFPFSSGNEGARSSVHLVDKSIAAEHNPLINSVPPHDANSKNSADASMTLPVPQPKS